MPINNKDYEVIEDTINDFEYFYDDEEDEKRNKKIIFKYRLTSILIFVVTAFFCLTVLGLIRMKAYDTKNILTKNEIRISEFKKSAEETRLYLANFCIFTNGELNTNSTLTINKINDRVWNDELINVASGSEDLYNSVSCPFENIIADVTYYQDKLESIKVEKFDNKENTYLSYRDSLVDCLNLIYCIDDSGKEAGYLIYAMDYCNKTSKNIYDRDEEWNSNYLDLLKSAYNRLEASYLAVESL